MMQALLEILRCPVTRSRLTIHVIATSAKELDGGATQVIEEAVLYGEQGWFYPVVGGIPRLNPDAFLEYAAFLSAAMPDYLQRKQQLMQANAELIQYVVRKNKRTRQSFSKEWSLQNPNQDKTWNADHAGMMRRFLTEVDETIAGLQGKWLFDAGCGNGKLNELLGAEQVQNLAMDFSNSIEMAYTRNRYACVHYVQGDVQFPPVAPGYFDIVHCSGVLIHTNNTELSFSCIDTAVKAGGKLSVWLYHHRKDRVHNAFNAIRTITSRLPLGLQQVLYRFIFLPVLFTIKKLKGNPQTARELMIDILDWFSPQYRWEHGHSEVASWFYKRQYQQVKITTEDIFGINMIGLKQSTLP